MPDSKELFEEFKSVFSGSNSLLDSLLPPLLFLIINTAFGFQPALWASLGIGAVITILRLLQRQKASYALGGLSAALLAIGLRYLLNSAQAFFLPAIINGGLTTLVLLISILVKRPAVAFTSALTRRWSLGWYWHPRVRPAYSEVTAIWVVYFALKLAVQVLLYRQGNVDGLALLNLIGGWPALILLLIISYLFGLKHLHDLKRPSVQEFLQNLPSPWRGQQRGF
ncbi:MAG: DUF3159 domain-containing protein [Pelolinea sp.]|nr:DUF3159 domain-containing protein [Pelolinea sp.]